MHTPAPQQPERHEPQQTPRQAPRARPTMEDRLAEALGEATAGSRRPTRIVADVTYRQPHLMYGSDGYSVTSNEFLWAVLAKAIAQRNMTPTEAAVLCYLMGKQKAGVVIISRQQDIADWLELPRTNVSAALARLEGWHWIRRTGRKHYQVNMTLIFRGNGDVQQQALDAAQAVRLTPDDFPEVIVPSARTKKGSNS